MSLLPQKTWLKQPTPQATTQRHAAGGAGGNKTQQAQQQRALDIGYEDFARETTYPQQQLQEMSSVLRGFNLPVSTYTTSQTQQAPPSFGQPFPTTQRSP